MLAGAPDTLPVTRMLLRHDLTLQPWISSGFADFDDRFRPTTLLDWRVR